MLHVSLLVLLNVQLLPHGTKRHPRTNTHAKNFPSDLRTDRDYSVHRDAAGNGVHAMPRRLDAVGVAAREPTRLVRAAAVVTTRSDATRGEGVDASPYAIDATRPHHALAQARVHDAAAGGVFI